MEKQEQDKDSVLNYYRKLLSVRKSEAYKEVFTYGEFIPAYENTEDVMAYYRLEGDKRILVAANFGREMAELQLEYPVKGIILSNQAETGQFSEERLKLKSCEAVVLEC